MKFTKAKAREDGSTPSVDLAIPIFGYQNHISIDRGFGFIRKWAATDAAAYEGRQLREGCSTRPIRRCRVGELSQRFRQAQLDASKNYSRIGAGLIQSVIFEAEHGYGRADAGVFRH